jgi:hypothetical protein
MGSDIQSTFFGARLLAPSKSLDKSEESLGVPTKGVARASGGSVGFGHVPPDVGRV